MKTSGFVAQICGHIFYSYQLCGCGCFVSQIRKLGLALMSKRPISSYVTVYNLISEPIASLL